MNLLITHGKNVTMKRRKKRKQDLLLKKPEEMLKQEKLKKELSKDNDLHS